MAERPFTQADLDILAQWDTPTICNGLEITSPERRAYCYTVEPMVCLYANAKPIVGLARVGMIRSTEPPRGKVVDRADWYDYVAATDFPTIAVIQDVDGRVGYGAYWGEVQSNIHKALGAIGCVTNGSFRDMDMWAKGFQMLGGRIGPSHAWVHMVEYGRPVNLFGMQAGHWLLEDHRNPIAANVAHLRQGQVEQVPVLEHDLPAGHASRRRHQPHDRQRQNRLAATGLADDAEGPTAANRNIDTIDRRDFTNGGMKDGAQTRDREKMGRAGGCLLSLAPSHKRRGGLAMRDVAQAFAQ